MNKTNLNLLAYWLLKNNDYLVEYDKFHMRNYRSYGTEGMTQSHYYDRDTDPKDVNLCGTAGCAAGWGPFSGIPELRPQDSTVKPANGGIYWMAYTRTTFGITDAEEGHEQWHWDWCFDAAWTDYDNTPKGAAIRILLLTGELTVPDHFFEDYKYNHQANDRIVVQYNGIFNATQ